MKHFSIVVLSAVLLVNCDVDDEKYECKPIPVVISVIDQKTKVQKEPLLLHHLEASADMTCWKPMGTKQYKEIGQRSIKVLPPGPAGDEWAAFYVVEGLAKAAVHAGPFKEEHSEVMLKRLFIKLHKCAYIRVECSILEPLDFRSSEESKKKSRKKPPK